MVGRRGTVWGLGQPFVLPRVGTSLLAQNEKGQQPLTPGVPFTSLEKRCRDFNRFPPDVSGLIKPPPLGSGQQGNRGRSSGNANGSSQ